MATTRFETLMFAKSLKSAGFDDTKAEAISEAFKEAQETSHQNLATRSDLTELELRINAQLMLLKWMMGFILAGVISLVLKAFFVQ